MPANKSEVSCMRRDKKLSEDTLGPKRKCCVCSRTKYVIKGIKDLSFHSFPQKGRFFVRITDTQSKKVFKQDRFYAWLQFAKLEEHEVKSKYLCSLHFKKEDFFIQQGLKKKRLLKNLAVPSIYNLHDMDVKGLKPNVAPLFKTGFSSQTVSGAERTLAQFDFVSTNTIKLEPEYTQEDSTDGHSNYSSENNVSIIQDELDTRMEDLSYLPVDIAGENLVQFDEPSNRISEREYYHISGRCRICAQIPENSTEIFSPEGRMKCFKEKINLHLPIKIMDSESLLPLRICQACEDQLEVAHQLWEQCKEADTLLQTLLKEQELVLAASKETECSATLPLNEDTGEEFVDCLEAEDTQIDQMEHNVKPQVSSEVQIDPMNIERDTGILSQTSTTSKPATSTISHSLSSGKLRVNKSIDPKVYSFNKTEKSSSDTSAKPKTPFKPLMISELLGEEKPKNKPGFITILPMPPPPKHLMCDKCPIGTYTMKALKDHYIYTHRTYICEYCREWYTSFYELEQHENEAHKVKCGFCDKYFIDIAPHVRDAHDDISPVYLKQKPFHNENISCEFCDEKLPNKQATKNHIFHWHQKYACDFCLELFSTSAAQKEHTEEVHFICCTICDEVFYTEFKLRMHLKKDHKSSYPVRATSLQKMLADDFACLSCQKNLSSKINLKRHNFWAHKLFTCDFCMKEFKTVDSESQHFNEVHTTVCFLCSCQNIVDLTSHLKCNHPEAKPFCCESCGNSFSYRSELDNHRKVHAPEKNNLCSLCGKTFRYPTNLAIHMKQTHSKLEYSKYGCTVCERKFVFPSELRKHMQIHDPMRAGQKLFRKQRRKKKLPSDAFYCEHCGESFEIKQLMLNHIKSWHLNI